MKVDKIKIGKKYRIKLMDENEKLLVEAMITSNDAKEEICFYRS